ncbi:unnamed protein product, partial [Mesorhabditis belari]|uniref:Uncharacterized protein n=1 Tax=Mesorhabditis belari TaxID=2138241 RepID=A0AAF3J4D2_9BILA
MFWLIWHDLLVVLLITVVLSGIYIPIYAIYKTSWTIGVYSFLLDAPTLPDVDYDFVEQSSFVLSSMSDWSYASSIPTTILAAFFAATNDQLTLPIRLLATAENLTKLAYSVTWLLSRACVISLANLQCSQEVYSAFMNLYDFSAFFDLTSVAQYCQMLISLSQSQSSSISSPELTISIH